MQKWFRNRIARTARRRIRPTASPHARTEHVFACTAQLGGKILHLIGLARATLHLNWQAAAYNLRRLCYLKEANFSAI